MCREASKAVECENGSSNADLSFAVHYLLRERVGGNRVVHRIRQLVPLWHLSGHTRLAWTCSLRRDRWLHARFKDNGLRVSVWTLDGFAASTQYRSGLARRMGGASTIIEISAPITEVIRTA